MNSGPETGAFARHLGKIAAALDRFVEFEHPDALVNADVWRKQLGGPLPTDGAGIDAVIAELTDVLIPNGSRISEPGFSGFITTGPTTAPTAAATASAIAAPQRYTMSAFNFVEEVSLLWLAELAGLGSHMKGVYVSGGSVANLVALGAARQHAYEAVGIDPGADGLTGPSPVIYTSSEAHHTVQRAAGVLGLGRSAIRFVPIDERQRMRPDALEQMMRDDRAAGLLPVAVVAAAGTTNTGAIDPLSALGDIARANGVWFHVDGAYGLLGRLDERVADRYAGLELADSVIVDPHKWLAAPVGVAAAFVRDRAILHRAFTQGPAEYLEGSFVADDDIHNSMDSMGIPYGDFAVELSAPARGVQVWAVIRELGVSGIRDFIVHDNDLARRVTAAARAHPRLEALTEPELSIACFRYRPPNQSTDGLNDLNERILRRLVRETAFAPSATVVAGAFAIRPCFINPRTTLADVDGMVEAVVRLGDDESGSGEGP
ncbi:MAG: aminotransferase class V-fold PLP-dependent enzyme [Acidimicrobiia bacterium]|nr:aminotransferase class V-fold PLP-dependent enzyme [Acidimicrobiia bacterium]